MKMLLGDKKYWFDFIVDGDFYDIGYILIVEEWVL